MEAMCVPRLNTTSDTSQENVCVGCVCGGRVLTWTQVQRGKERALTQVESQRLWGES